MPTIQCSGETRAKKRCRRKLTSSDPNSIGYCYAHLVRKPKKITPKPKKIQSSRPVKVKPVLLTPYPAPGTGEEAECAICLIEMEIGELTPLPNCQHNIFHLECLEKCQKQMCPLCRASHNIPVAGPAAPLPPHLVPDPDPAIIQEVGGVPPLIFAFNNPALPIHDLSEFLSVLNLDDDDVPDDMDDDDDVPDLMTEEIYQRALQELNLDVIPPGLHVTEENEELFYHFV